MAREMAHPGDLLLTANLAERAYHRQFTASQVLPATMPERARGLDRAVHKLWYTQIALVHPGAKDVLVALDLMARRRGEVFTIAPVEEWTPESPSIIAKINALQPPSKQAQHRAGYRKAITDVLALLTEELSE